MIRAAPTARMEFAFIGEPSLQFGEQYQNGKDPEHGWQARTGQQGQIIFMTASLACGYDHAGTL